MSNSGPGPIRIVGGIVTVGGIIGQMMYYGEPGSGFAVSIGVTLVGVVVAMAGKLSEQSSNDEDNF